MVRKLGLQRAHQHFKIEKTTQILETRILQKKRPACKSGADTTFEPFEGSFAPL
jgi:hypothetical protein